MVDPTQSQRMEEYASLRKELLQSKQYVFERPLLIITATIIASTQFNDINIFIAILPTVLIITLLANLSFTVNRMKSYSRIAAYIEVVLEPGSPVEWIGWETSLRESRIWCRKNLKKGEDFSDWPVAEDDIAPRTMMFYPSILWFHIVLVILALGISASPLITELYFYQSSAMFLPLLLRVENISLLVNVILAAGFAVLCIGSFNPRKLKNLIEIQRTIWLSVLPKKQPQQSNTHGVLWQIMEKLL